MRIKPGTLIYSDKLFIRISRHLLLFLFMNLLFIWVAYKRSSDGNDILEVSGMVIFNSLFFFSYAYITTYILFPLILLKHKYVLFGLFFLLTGICISYVKFFFSDYLFYDAIAAELSHRIKNVDLAHVVVNTKDMTFIVAIFLIAKYAKDNYKMQNQLRDLREWKLESEIKLIHNQLNPHVVFNNLNNLYSISLNNPQQVLPNIRKLKALLTYYFSVGKSPLVKLNDELEMIDNFIGLEKLRYGDRLKMNYQVAGESDEHFIIPFVLFSIVENCFEHGCSVEAGNSWINIKVDIRKKSLIFHVANSKPNTVSPKGKDHPEGSENKISKRLELLYPGRHQFIIEDEPGTYSVTLKLKFP